MSVSVRMEHVQKQLVGGLEIHRSVRFQWCQGSVSSDAPTQEPDLSHVITCLSTTRVHDVSLTPLQTLTCTSTCTSVFFMFAL